jgi:2-polyprenyl-3-methyl-5-hydroxy-6-metoxy-1,4-benzoquinol methylase
MSSENNRAKKIKSPITGNTNTREVQRFDIQKIINLYQTDFGISVKRFFENTDSLILMECMDTSYKFYYPYTVFGDTPFYEELQKVGERKFGNDNYYPEWKWEYAEGLKWVKRGESVLDIGCGSGAFIHKVNTEYGNKVVGLEFNRNALNECRNRGLEVHPVPIQEFGKTFQKFDVVSYFQVLEHIEDPVNFIRASLEALKPGGTLIIAVPNNNPFYLCFEEYATLNLPPHHAGLWNKDAFSNLPKYLPFKLLSVSASETPSIIHYLFYFSRSTFIRTFKSSQKVWWFYPFAALLLPISIPIVLYKKITKKLIGRTLVAVFQKNK